MKTRDLDTKYTFLIKFIEILHLKKNLEFFSSNYKVFLFNHGLYGYILLASSFSLCNSVLKYRELHKERLKKDSLNCVLTVYLYSALSYETKDVYFSLWTASKVCWRLSLEILLPFNSDVAMLFTVSSCFSKPLLTFGVTLERTRGTTEISQPTKINTFYFLVSF